MDKKEFSEKHLVEAMTKKMSIPVPEIVEIDEDIYNKLYPANYERPSWRITAQRKKIFLLKDPVKEFFHLQHQRKTKSFTIWIMKMIVGSNCNRIFSNYRRRSLKDLFRTWKRTRKAKFQT